MCSLLVLTFMGKCNDVKMRNRSLSRVNAKTVNFQSFVNILVHYVLILLMIQLFGSASNVMMVIHLTSLVYIVFLMNKFIHCAPYKSDATHFGELNSNILNKVLFSKMEVSFSRNFIQKKICIFGF